MKAFPDGLELDAGLASPMLVTDWERGMADLAKPRVLVFAPGFDGGGAVTSAGAGLGLEAVKRLAGTLHAAAGGAPPVLLGPGFDPALLAALVIGKLRGMVAGAAVAADEPALAAAAELCRARPAFAAAALAEPSNWGSARRVVMTRNRTWIWAPEGWPGWESTAGRPPASAGTLQDAFARAEAAALKAMRGPFAVPVSNMEAPALPGAGFLAGAGPAGPFSGRILLLGAALTAGDVPALADLARKVLVGPACLVLALAAVEEGALAALAGSLGKLAGRVLVGALDRAGRGEDLAMATGGRYAAPELMMTAGMLGPEDLGTFTGARLSGGGLRLTGTAKPQQCTGHLKVLNRDYLLAESDAERDALRDRCGRFAGMLDPDAMLAYLRRAAEGRW